MAGSDIFSNTTVPQGDWSSDITLNDTSAGDLVSVTVNQVDAGGDVVLDGTVANTGDIIDVSFNGGDFVTQLQAVCDVPGGIVLTDGFGDNYLFSNTPLSQTTYSTAAGYGHYFDAPGDSACFAIGTRIETHRGLVPVEALRPGDRVRTLLGRGFAPVVWVGHRRVACTRHPRPREVWPVRIATGAFGPGQPLRDLYLSPDHAVFVHGVLIPVRYLLNGATITQAPVPRVSYWHVELAAHDVLLAEGLATESFLDTGNRAAFDNAGPLVQLDPSFGADFASHVWSARACAPLLLDIEGHVPIRRRLRERARLLGHRDVTDAALGFLAGMTALPTAWDGSTARASVPAGTRTLRLSSRVTVPGEQIDGSRDERRLGVAVTRITLDEEELALDDARLGSGWHRPEPDWRWTAGQAILTLDHADRARTIRVTTVPMLRYWASEQPQSHDRAA